MFQVVDISNDNNPIPFESARYSDPEATHVVECASERFGYGIYGYFKGEMQANAVKRWLASNGCKSTVKPYDPNHKIVPGIHPLINAHMRDYI